MGLSHVPIPLVDGSTQTLPEIVPYDLECSGSLPLVSSAKKQCINVT
jgi:hypothetical protein